MHVVLNVQYSKFYADLQQIDVSLCRQFKLLTASWHGTLKLSLIYYREMEKQLSQVMTIEQEFIDQVIVSPQGIDVVHVEFDVVRRPFGNGVILTEVDVATTVYHLDRKIRNGDVIIIYGVSSVC